MVAIDHSLDHLQWDNIETTTIRTYRNNVEVDTETDFAFKVELSRRDQLMYNAHSLTGDERTWVVANLDLDTAGQEIRRGDKIAQDAIADLDADTVWWSVRQASNLDNETLFRCICTKDR